MTSHFFKPIRLLLLSLPLCLTVQEAVGQTDSSEADVIEELIITGSNIRRKRDHDLASPIQTLDQIAVEGAGAGQVQDLLRTLPVNAGSELSTSQSQRQGVSQFSLRGLGVSGTLTLINGRRAGISPVASDDGQFFTDVNQYPVNMIGSVEVLTDGASATYGSEAVSGVVNLITRRIDGAELAVEARTAINSVEQLSLAFGSAFDEGKGQFSLFVNSYSQDGNFRSEFDFIQSRSNNGGNGLDTASQFDSGTGQGRYNLAVETDTSGEYERAIRTVGIGDDAMEVAGNTVPDPHCAASGPGNFVDGTNCRYNFIDQRRLIPEESRFQLFGHADYDLSDRAELFAEFSFSTNRIYDAIGGAVLRTTTHDGGFLVPAAHPFNYFVSNADADDADQNDIRWDPAAVTANSSLAVPVIVRQRPLTSYYDGARAADIVRNFDNTRALLGVSIDLSDSWHLTASYMTAHSKFTDIQPRSYNAAAYQQAITDGVWNPFGISTAEPGAVSVKDGESVAANTAEDLIQFAANRTFVAESTQNVLEAIFNRDVYQYADGRTIAIAVGFQTRSLEYNDIPDSLSYFRLDGRADPVVSISDAQQSTTAFFAEAIIPFSEKVEMQAAIRQEDYGDTGGGATTDPKLGVRFQVSDTTLLRGSLGSSFQAPSIRNVFGSVGSGTLNDDTGGGLTAGDTCDAETNDSFNAAQITTGAALTPQNAINYNLGAVFTPSRFTGTVDYWYYDYTDLIQTGESFQSILDGECADDVYVPDARVVRDPSGQLNSVTTSFINVGSVEATGVDLSAGYEFDDVLGGQMLLSAQGTLILGFDIIQTAGGTAFDGAGNRNRFIGFGAIPDLRYNFGLRWNRDVHSVELAYRFIGDYTDEEPGGDTQTSIESQTLLDAQYAYDFSNIALTLTAGINNLTDEEPPAVQERIAYDYEVHDPRGRITYLRLKYNF